MQVNISAIAKDKGASLPLDLSEPDCPFGSVESGGLGRPDVLGCEGPVRFVGQITNAGRYFYLSGKAEVVVEAVCSRCLASFPYFLQARVEREYRRSTSWVPSGRGHEREGAPGASRDGNRCTSGGAVGDRTHGAAGLGAEDDQVELLSGDVVDILPAVREELTLALPMRFLCRADCQGICPVCGTNRNERDCGCQPEPADPRLAVFSQLRAKDRPPDDSRH